MFQPFIPKLVGRLFKLYIDVVVMSTFGIVLFKFMYFIPYIAHKTTAMVHRINPVIFSSVRLMYVCIERWPHTRDSMHINNLKNKETIAKAGKYANKCKKRVLLI